MTEPSMWRCMLFVPTEKLLADILTEGLQKKLFEVLTSELGILDIFNQFEGEFRKIRILVILCSQLGDKSIESMVFQT